jgi:hypothetical protein
MSIRFGGAIAVEFPSNLTLRTNRSKMVEVDLTVAHSDASLGLEALGMTFQWVTIERCDAALNYRLKQTDGSLSDIFRAAQGRRISNHDFKDIIVSNPAGSGVCRFIVGYWED